MSGTEEGRKERRSIVMDKAINRLDAQKVSFIAIVSIKNELFVCYMHSVM